MRVCRRRVRLLIILVRQTERLQRFARKQGWDVSETVMETASGMNGKRRKLMRVLTEPGSLRLVVEHRKRLTRCHAGNR